MLWRGRRGSKAAEGREEEKPSPIPTDLHAKWKPAKACKSIQKQIKQQEATNTNTRKLL